MNIANPLERLPFKDSRHPLIYTVARFTLEQYLKYQYDLQIYNAQYLEHKDTRVYVPTHTEAIDPEALGVVALRALPTMAKDELWTDDRYKKKGIQLGEVLGIVDAFPVRREGDDTSAYRIADAHLKAGRSTGVFAQGTRNLNFDALLQGGPRLAYRNNLAVQPMAIATHKGLIRVIVGEPLTANYDLPKKQAIDELTNQVSTVFKRDYPRAVAWAEFDASRPRETKKFGYVKRYP